MNISGKIIQVHLCRGLKSLIKNGELLYKYVKHLKHIIVKLLDLYTVRIDKQSS